VTVPCELDGSVVAITGGGSGIGRAIARSFAARGARIVASDIDLARAEETAALVEAAGGDATALRVDVADQRDLEALRDACTNRFGRVDVVVNNVGVLAMGPPEALPVEAWQRVFDLNILGVARSNALFLPLLLEQGRGHVVNTASASGLLAYGFDRLPYVASKHALVGISEALALYLGPRGIGVTCICPSGVATNILEQITTYGSTAATPRAPEHPIVDPDEVGELAADAVAAGRFLVVTAPEIQSELIERATDIEGYLGRRIARQVP
jgi:NAD(P)-dependent dehydrogenase (short-subunit alcohol dehydrogenase family)